MITKKSLFLWVFFTSACLFVSLHTQPLDAYESSGASNADTPFAEGEYRLGVGDLLQIEVYDEPDLTKETRVLTDGMISFPLLGSIRAIGFTVRELEQKITLLLAQDYLVNPQVTVIVKEFSHVYVFGEVKNPGAFPIYGKLTVFEAITLAGGFTPVANQNNIKIIRQEGQHEMTYDVDIERITKKGDTTQDRELRANDRVIVSRSMF